MRRLMNRRFAMERDEGKQYNEPGISEAMKAVNNQFRIAHGCSMLINLIISLSLVAYPFVASSLVV